MNHVTGIGGIFFKAEDPKSLKEWYREHLGIDAGDYGATFNWREDNDPTKQGQTVWTPFPKDTKYFDPGTAPFMINYRVADLDGLVKALREEGVEVKSESSEYGSFAWISDPEGNRIELWEPAAESPDSPPKTD
jgi:predicted enzyme related to lactoylglutathione lyase